MLNTNDDGEESRLEFGRRFSPWCGLRLSKEGDRARPGAFDEKEEK
jgi:hypothetical protein